MRPIAPHHPGKNVNFEMKIEMVDPTNNVDSDWVSKELKGSADKVMEIG